MKLELNVNVKTKNAKHKVFCQDPSAQEQYNLLSKSLDDIGKDPKRGDVAEATVTKIDGVNIYAETDSGQQFVLDARKEELLMSNDVIIGRRIPISVEGIENRSGYSIGSGIKAWLKVTRDELLATLKDTSSQSAYPGYIESAQIGAGFVVNIAGLKCFMPGSHAGANKLENYDQLVGQNIIVMVEGYSEQLDSVIVSRKKYIQAILPERVRELNKDTLYKGRVTGISNFGIFVEWNDSQGNPIFTGLLHETEMYLDKNDYKQNEEISFYVKRVQSPEKIVLTQRAE